VPTLAEILGLVGFLDDGYYMRRFWETFDVRVKSKFTKIFTYRLQARRVEVLAGKEQHQMLMKNISQRSPGSLVQASQIIAVNFGSQGASQWSYVHGDLLLPVHRFTR